MLTESEKKELNYDNLTPELKLKIDTAFESPDLIIALAYSSQIQALANEMILDPFTIRGSTEIQLSAGGEGVDIEKQDAQARQRTETALKVLDKLDALGEKLKSVQANLSTEQVNILNKRVVTAKDLKGIALGKTG